MSDIPTALRPVVALPSSLFSSDALRGQAKSIPADSGPLVVERSVTSESASSVWNSTPASDSEAERIHALQRADLITGTFPFDRAALERSFSQFLDRLGDRLAPDEVAERPFAKALWWVAAVVSLEAARRWRRRVGALRTTETRRRHCASHGLS
jgi:hypothetical protein